MFCQLDRLFFHVLVAVAVVVVVCLRSLLFLSFHFQSNSQENMGIPLKTVKAQVSECLENLVLLLFQKHQLYRQHL